MKKLNVAVMSLLATAAFTFNSCSTDDALTPGSGTSNQEIVDDPFVKLSFDHESAAPVARTAQSNEFNAIAASMR